MVAGFRLKLFGGFLLHRSDGQEVRLRGRTNSALFAYLALNAGQRLSREKVANFLWVEENRDTDVRTRLRVALAGIRQALEATERSPVVSDADWIWADAEVLEVDVRRFERLAAEHSPEALAAAAELYAGELLEGFDVVADDAADFNDWLRDERKRLLDVAIDVYSRLTDLQADAGQFDQAIASARRTVKLEDLREASHCRLMKAYALAGRRDQAVQSYNSLCAILRRDLGMDPDPSTTTLYKAIRDGSFPSPDQKLSGQVPEPPSVLVVPFKAYGDSDAIEYANAISDAIGMALGIASEMRVMMATGSSGSDAMPIDPAANGFPSRYVLGGAVGKFGAKISIQPRLVDRSDGERQVWARRYDGSIDDFLGWQRDIVLTVISELKVKLVEGEGSRIDRTYGTKNLSAYLAVSEGEKHLRRFTMPDNVKAREFYETANRLDPNYAATWEGLAWTYLLEARFGWTNSPQTSIGKSVELATEAQRLDPQRPRTRALFGILALAEGEHDAAIRIGREAAALNASDTDTRAMLAYTYTYSGEPETAIDWVRQAIRNRPYPPNWYHWVLSRAYRLAGKAKEASRELLASDAGTTDVSLVELILCHAEMNRPHEARLAAQQLLALSPEFSISRFALLAPYKDPQQAERERGVLRKAGLRD
jgi:DNA-binding SARP family transcriptional activator